MKVRGHRLELLEIEAVMKQEAIDGHWIVAMRLDVWELDVGTGKYGKIGSYMDFRNARKIWNIHEYSGILDGSFFRPKTRTDWHLGLRWMALAGRITTFAAGRSTGDLVSHHVVSSVV